ncbi:hypothetical protein HYS97_00925 [Candidatus Daviesbacteria bacterium]|nr:hypothetical protein [Candidatus Daviesbacteria bacterium]
MSFKSLVLVIIFSALIGVVIFLLIGKGDGKIIQPLTNSSQASKPEVPTPKPTLPPLDENSNLEQEINKLDPPNFSEDIENLRNEL